MKSYLKNYRQSPRKVRLVADLIRGKSVKHALIQLEVGGKRANSPIVKLIKSAVSNAKNNFDLDDNDLEENLRIKEIRIDKGIVLKRIMPRARGSAARINKRSSHISIVLEQQSAIEENNKKNTKKPNKNIANLKSRKSEILTAQPVLQPISTAEPVTL